MVIREMDLIINCTCTDSARPFQGRTLGARADPNDAMAILLHDEAEDGRDTLLHLLIMLLHAWNSPNLSKGTRGREK